MRPETATTVRKAGVYLQAALVEVESDPGVPVQLKLQLRQLGKLARVLADVPTHAAEVDLAPHREELWAECPSCHLRRPLTGLSGGSCPRCGTQVVTP